MDVRCEKCQTEYELDEARLKPGGVTVKCTNCGHMFKIRKRSPTNAGVTPSPDVPRRGGESPTNDPRLRPPSARSTPQDPGAEEERHWLIRLENGEQKSCRELATLQQWIIANIVTRESLISRTGKTWKRLGDIAELAQYFDIADEARTTRAAKPTPTTKTALAGTMLGIGGAPRAAGGAAVDDEGIDTRATGNFTRTATGSPQPKIPPGTKTPPMGSGTSAVLAAAAAAGPPPESLAQTVPAHKVPTQPPPGRSQASTPPSSLPSLKAPPPADGRSTAAWVKDPVKQAESSGKSGPSGPFGGKISAIPDEPAFAGRVRAIPSDESSFETGKVRVVSDEDDDLLPPRRGGRMGIAILLMVLLVGGGAAAAVYFLVIKKDAPAAAQAPADAMQVAAADAAAVVSPITVDAAPEQRPHETARAELPTDDETRLRTAMASLAPIDEPPANAVRALLIAAVAQSLTDRAALVDSKSEADKLRKEATSLLIEAATAAQKAQKALPDDPSANLAMAEVLRLQGKPVGAFKQYTSTARARAAGTDWARDVALHEAHVLRREAGKGTSKLAEALAAFAAIDSGDGALEKSADVRARVQRALILLAQNKPAEARPLVEQVLAAQQGHAAAKALGSKLDTLVAKDDPLPPEDDNKGSAGSTTRPPDGGGGGGGGGDSHDSLIDRANKLADSNCTKAMELYSRALEVKPTSIEALTGLGYCHMDAKQFASAHSRFRSALAISPRYEPALLGVAEAYQQQGLRDEAIAAYKATLEAHPNSAKAKRQLDRLTGGGAGGTTGGGSGSGATTPPEGGSATPPPPPTPTPAPTPAPAGSGSAG